MSQTSKSSPAKPSTSESNRPKERDQQPSGLAEPFKCIDKQLRKDAEAIVERVTKQIEKGFTIKQMVDWINKAQNKPHSIGGFEEMLSTMELEAIRDSAN